MRVTERGRYGQMIQNNAKAAERFQKAAGIASSGTDVQKPSDDPATYGSMVRRNYSLKIMEERSKNATRAQNELSVVESSLSNGIDILVAAKETTIAAANGTADPANRKAAAESIRTMRAELLSIANTRYGDRYLFGGTQTGTAPFDTTTGNFVGNDQVVNVPVLDGVAPPANLSGSKTFTAAGGVDIFKTLGDLATALDNNDDAAIKASLDPLTKSHDQLVHGQVQSGFAADRFRQAVDVLTSTTMNVTERLAQEINGDPAQQLSELTLSKSAYERSIAVSQQLLSISSNWR